MDSKVALRFLWFFFLIPGLAYPEEATLKSTSDEQVGVEVTVYNNDLGLVKDTRKIALPKGRGELRFMDVAASIMPWTVSVKSMTNPESFSVLEQNYEYDLINRAKLLDKYVDKQVKLMHWNYYQDRKEVVDATLLSNNQGEIYLIDKEIYLGHPGIPILPKLPENLIAKPTLTWLFENNTDKPHQLEVSYLTKNISWKTDYVITVNANDTAADVLGWVTLDNKSGTTYKDARLKLIAGEIHQAETNKREKMLSASEEMPRPKALPSFEEKSFFEYHMYSLQRKTTIKDKQTKQVNLLEAFGIGVKKELLVYGVKTYWIRQFRETVPKQPVNVYLVFKNSKENKLGMPLPAGLMRVYKQDTDGNNQFIGEDKISHTPKDEEVKLLLGNAFDVVAERSQTDFKQVTSRLYETEWQINVRNHKDEEVTVGIIEPLLGNWNVIQTSHPFKKMDAFTIRYDVKVPKDDEVKVKYRVRVGI